jgi:hypothetical protein
MGIQELTEASVAEARCPQDDPERIAIEHGNVGDHDRSDAPLEDGGWGRRVDGAKASSRERPDAIGAGHWWARRHAATSSKSWA